MANNNEYEHQEFFNDSNTINRTLIVLFRRFLKGYEDKYWDNDVAMEIISEYDKFFKTKVDE